MSHIATTSTKKELEDTIALILCIRLCNFSSSNGIIKEWSSAPHRQCPRLPTSSSMLGAWREKRSGQRVGKPWQNPAGLESLHTSTHPTCPPTWQARHPSLQFLGKDDHSPNTCRREASLTADYAVPRISDRSHYQQPESKMNKPPDPEIPRPRTEVAQMAAPSS
ncbi:hypothetical protein BT67DRAFT_190524 [Trichocladium antarcticum]|uniref:Uncharacterized protein n=1 Tax=Trichocladium antarcticum TaxID=1450529 RepID=A0AAN6UPG2_9PEZI|nr:hypothetical protein BT67DRAFT_190524 [Trichocladium antarcticum]